ncbi:MAG: hypothetical protein LBJ67_18640 [Planctomycetaceae bacterium]|jgi:hypothetical protein|nr:hypothetical protein [Planctomycetaceae bacterium]
MIIVKTPQVVQNAVENFVGRHFRNTSQRNHVANQRYVYGHDLLFIDYVHPTSGKHYPIDFRRYKKAEQCELTKEDFTKLLRLAMELIQQCHDQNISGTFTFDSVYSTVEMLNFIDSLKNADGTNRRYVGDVKFNRTINFKGRKITVEEFAKTIPAEDRTKMTTENGIQWYLAVNVTIPNVMHKVRIVILWKHKNDAEPRQILVSNNDWRKLPRYAERIVA